jgi:hypothetical protein
MNDTDKQSFSDALDELYAFYEAHTINRDAWWRILSKYPLEQVKAGFDAHMADPEQGIYPPKPAHIVGHIERLKAQRPAAQRTFFEAAPEDAKRLPLTYEFTPLYWAKLKEGFNTHGLRGNELTRWAREQSGVQLIVGDPLTRWLEHHSDDPQWGPLIKRSLLFAEGKGTKEDKHEHLQDLIRMVQGIATPLPYDPRRRHLPTEGVDNSKADDPQPSEFEASVEEDMI